MMISHLILENCRVFDGWNAELQDGVSVEIEGGLIRALQPGRIASATATRIDVAGRLLMPGLIDAHFHCYGLAMNPKAIDAMPAALRALHARQLMEEALQRGFTTVRDAAGGDYALAKGVQDGLIKGPRLFFPGLALSQTGGHGDMRHVGGEASHYACLCRYCGALSMVVDGEEEVRRAVREQLRHGAHHVKIFVSGGVVSPSDPLWMNQMSDAEIRAAVAEAATRRAYVMAHAHTAEAATRAARLGVRSIEHGTLMDDASVRVVVEQGAYVVPTLVVIEALQELGPRLGLDAVSLSKVDEVAQGAMASLERLYKAGARIGLGTDLLGSTTSRQSREFRLRREVCSALDILRSATRINAELVQREGQLGTVAVGAIADVLVLDGNPLDDITVLENAEALRLILRDGQFFKRTL